MLKKMIALILCCVMVLPFCSPAMAVAYTASITDENAIVRTTLSNFDIVENEAFLTISGQIGQQVFSVSGKIYNMFDHIHNNKYHFVETNPDYAASVFIINLEFEAGAKSENLEVMHQAWVGMDVIRLTAYISGTIYYVEQPYEINSLITNNSVPISVAGDDPVVQTICSNTTWYTHLNDQNLAPDVDSGISLMAVASNPIYGESLDSTDISVLNDVGANKLTSEVFTYGWTTNGGYILQCTEWPMGSGNMLASCLYYSIIKRTPDAGTSEARLQFQLTADRQYVWNAGSNIIESFSYVTDYAIFDLKLALECVQYTAGNGYDFISQRTISAYGSSQSDNNLAFTIALSVAKQYYDKYGILTIASDIFDSFSSHDPEPSGSDICIWESDFDAHYNSFDAYKKQYTMVRAVRVDTDGRLLSEEGNRLLLKAEIQDRDYQNSTANVSMRKAIAFAVSYNLRSKNGIMGWLFDGNDHGDITYEGYESYYR